MPYRTFLSLLICLQTLHAYSQDSLRYNSKWHISTSFGVHKTLNPFFKGQITDPLVEFDDRTSSWKFLSLSYFFHKRWGVAVDMHFGYTKKDNNKAEQFRQTMEAQYENNYYITYSSTGDLFETDPGFVGKIGYAMVGVIYRKEFSGFFIYPKASVGITSFSGKRGRISLKQKNANDRFDVAYLPGKGGDNFTLSASALAGYKLTKRLFLHLEPMGSYFKTGFNYTKTTTNLNTQETITEVFPYNRKVFTLSLHAGLTYVLGTR